MALAPIQEKVRFGLFQLDLKTSQLTRGGTTIRVPQQPLRLLSVLIESPGEIVTREHLRQRLWPSDVFVDFDHGLNKSIQKLRDALGDSAGSPRYIETIPRVGYRFIGPVIRETPSQPPEADPDIAPAPPLEDPAHPPKSQVDDHRRATPWVNRWALPAVGIALLGAITAIALYLALHARPPVPRYTPLTDFTDSATTPALSPDGHMLAFIRGDDPFMSTGRIYVKMLPNGEAKLLTDDERVKYNLAFSPDGSQIAYTVMLPTGLSTYSVSALGGDPHLLVQNAAGLTWLDSQHYLFSRIRSGLHLGVVTQSTSGDNDRELYFPAHERAMAHYSFASPDRQHALVVVMNGQGAWSECQLISIATNISAPRSIGPHGECTAAAWSPDGKWMYFVATIDNQRHIWRQQYPDGLPEQITQGPSEDAGLAVEPNGRSIITSTGEYQSAIWIHDPAGERSLSSEGEIVAYDSPPVFAADGKTLYFLLRHHGDAYPNLWRLALVTGKSEAIFPGISITSYDISVDGNKIVYSNVGRDGKSQLWIAPMDRSTPARMLGLSGATNPHFGPQGQILFVHSEGNFNYLEQMNQDGSARSRVLSTPILEMQNISPQRRWLGAVVSSPQDKTAVPSVMLIPFNGGPPRHICAAYCHPVWSPDGRFLSVPVEDSSQTQPGRSLILPIGPDESLPPLPPGGIEPSAKTNSIRGAQSIDRADFVPGQDLAHYAYVKSTVHRNLYRISLP